jgi:hypothetical protein
MRYIPFVSPLRPTFVIILGLLLFIGTVGWGQTPREPQVTSEEEAPAAEAPPVAKPQLREPVPKIVKPVPSPSPDGSPKTIQSRIDRQGKEIAQLKQENAKLKEQVRLLFSIVNKLAGLQQGR